MIQMETLLNVADNSGAKTAKCIKVLGGSHRMTSKLGDVIVLAVQTIIPGAKVKKGEVVKGVIIRTKKECRRSDGSTIAFDDNAVVLIDKEGQPLGTRVMGPVARELRTAKGNFLKILSLAEEVL
jgi:large subunit ribosomal protein L14